VAAEVLTLPACYNKILHRFGRTILTNGILDKGRLAAAVFSAPAGRKWLERLLHPLILDRIKELLKRSRKKLAVVEAPLLFEAGLGECFTLTLCVAAPEKDCLRRALGRGWTRAQYTARRASQLPPEEKAARADLALYNAGSPRELESRVKSICRFLEAAGDRK
jgi:dephospho-CoA kinase